MIKLLLALATLAAPHKTKLAVLDVEDVSGNEAATARLLTQVLVGEAPKLGRFEVISSAEVRQVLGFERQKQLLGCKEDSCLAELGGAMGVDYLVSAQLGKLGKRYRLDLRLIDANKSRVVASEGDFLPGNEDALGDASVAMLTKLLEDAKLRSPSAAPPASVSSSASAGGSRVPAYVAGGAAVVLAAGAVFMTLQARSRYADDVNCYRTSPPASCAATYSPDTDAHIADALSVATAAAAATSAYFFVTATPAGSGGEVGLAGHF